jgi:hypothetical protein
LLLSLWLSSRPILKDRWCLHASRLQGNAVFLGGGQATMIGSPVLEMFAIFDFNGLGEFIAIACEWPRQRRRVGVLFCTHPTPPDAPV